jgi:exonuclease SbcC
MSKFEARIKEVKKKEPSLRKNVEELKKDLEDIKEGEFEVRSLKEIVSKKLSDSERLVKEASELEMKLEALAYEGEDLSVVDDFVAEYNALKGKADLLEKELSREEKIKREIAENEGDYFKGSNLKEELSARFNGIIFDRVMLDEAEKNRGHLLDKKYSVEGMIREAEFKVSENLMRQKEISEKRETFMELKKGRDETEGKLNILSRAREVFHTDRGLPKYLRDKYIHALGALLTQYFKRFNQNPAYKEIFFDKDYKIQVKATSGLLSLEQLSGGERVQLAVALRISLIEMLSPIRLLILDEPFGSLDAEHRELLGETLNKMAAGWQLILVTHVHVDSLQLESIQLEGY